ncbi:polyprenyl synthetase family protein [Nocardioides sp. SYSU D00038]|uniref:polyprenyl synthetase family protein n=1 Tax=Nocardioides sp. SYSU D00038 TaxID=2812554 RepID=UPI001968033A|nr:polyprenyl synthetase family protein [Nocardioides sp. SYSU D00038]
MSVAGIGGTAPAASPHDLDPAGTAAVDRVVQQLLERRGRVLAGVGTELELLSATLLASGSGGKRLRAAFCLWGARAASGGHDVAGATEAAAALELFHLAALVHDDLMDHSDERRGRPTVHRVFADDHRRRGGAGDPDDHGAAVAVLAGDLCLTWSDDLMADAVAAAPATGAAAREVWSMMRDEVLAGQYLDVLGQTGVRTSVDQVRRVLHYKSAKYTVEHPLLLGATLAGAPAALVASLRELGLAVGEAFQLRDDVLGVFGDPGRTGKPAVDDVREGKRTMLVAHAQERATRTQARVLRRHLGDPAATLAGVAAVREVLVATGALRRTEDAIEELVERAHDVLDGLDVDDRSRHALASLTDACAWRAA